MGWGGYHRREPRSIEPQSTEPRSIEPRSIEPRSTANRGPPKTAVRRTAVHREPRSTRNRGWHKTAVFHFIEPEPRFNRGSSRTDLGSSRTAVQIGVSQLRGPQAPFLA